MWGKVFLYSQKIKRIEKYRTNQKIKENRISALRVAAQKLGTTNAVGNPFVQLGSQLTADIVGLKTG